MEIVRNDRLEDLPAGVVIGDVSQDLRDAEADAAQLVPEIVADHGEELVSPRDDRIRVDAFEQEAPVCILPLLRQQLRHEARALRPLGRRDLIGERVFATKDLIGP